ncbi:hypothetical protein [Actinomycetospora termitidis]|uniref:Uncharacterized protein n=1 Tax=Actinomycetospora termitidis TaxID=3053470 RepID=A0ABT7MI01_9PSEU|nr:hypothetical protein [Actinomycetospora sp. Odt1-22]MDL5160276.1 hypothetical protein [Actinomycetospora sp. Odt1-22]
MPGWIEALGLSPATLVVGEPPADADRTWCVHPGPEATWELYWWEGGERYSWTRFDEESAACFALFGRLAWTQMMRGALRAG